MIVVKINKNKIIIEGHALYDDFGKDIVCAATSSIVTTTVNACLRINNDCIKYKEMKDLFQIDILKRNDIIDKLLINMIDLLDELSINYPKNIKVLKEE